MAADSGPMDITSGAGAAVGAVELGVGAATLNPIAIIGGIATLAGVGASIFGTMGAASAQKQEAEVSAQIAQTEMQIEQQRAQLATDIYNRQSVENFRRAQLAGATSRAVAAQQTGGQTSSGAVSGREQTAAEGAWNQGALYTNYTIGQNIFGLTGQIDQYQMRLAQLGGTAATDLGIASAGSAVAQATPALMRLSGGFGNFGGGGPTNPSGYTGSTGGLY